MGGRVDHVQRIASCGLLTARDKHAVLSLLAQTIELNCCGDHQQSWSVHDFSHVSTITGIDIYRNMPKGSSSVYKTRGQGIIAGVRPEVWRAIETPGR